MPTTYRKADDLQPLLAQVIGRYHADLQKHGVTFDIFTAHGDSESDEPALKHQGYAALAIVRINKLQDRVGGMADCRLTIDGERFEELTEKQQISLIDHEMTHVTIVMDYKTDKPKLDDVDRPKLRMRLHDVHVGIFEEVIQRHGANSMDAALCAPIAKLIQRYFPWADDDSEIRDENLAATGS